MMKLSLAMISLVGLAPGAPGQDVASLDLAGYSVITDEVTRAEANTACQNIGGQLAEILSRESNAYLHQLVLDAGITEGDGIWIGARRIDANSNDDSAFAWDVSTVPFGNGLPNVDADGNHDLWVRNEPNNYRGSEFCVRAGNEDGRWNDARCTQRSAFACWVQREFLLHIPFVLLLLLLLRVSLLPTQGNPSHLAIALGRGVGTASPHTSPPPHVSNKGTWAVS